MRINYILTFDKGNQTFGSCEVDPIFPTKESAVYYFKGLVSNLKRHLIKVSLCAKTSDPNGMPEWILECGGKLWSDDLGTVIYNKYW
jgi:hypothetical protein